ncbi:MAG TPA: glycosyl hydrolase, partial [Planctomycetota bacterium]|nr:glycosyl hydrolase [Planctomycetota bacterium]
RHRDGYRLVPWTASFVEEFKTRRGYDILDALPSYFYDGPRSVKVRHDYWKTVTELFAQNFSKQLGTWSREHGFALTGHYNAEGSLLSQMNSAGAVMPNYVWQDAPGIDILTEQRYEYLTAKQCSSVASQFGRKWVLSELYGCTGWEFTFEGMKWVGDWQFALGVTLRCPHLTLYTLKGCAKRDYPPSFNYNSTWWKYNRVHEDYFARLAACLTEGRPVRDILLVHPIASAWCEYDNERPEGPTRWNRRFEATMRTLLAQHRDFDLGDEMILADYADVKSGRLRVRKSSYPVVVLPPMLTMSTSTAELLERFLKSGGKVVALEPTATLVDALRTRRLAKIWKHRNTTVVAGSAALGEALDDTLAPTVRIRTTHGQELEPVLYQLRRAGKKRILFMCNTDRDVAHDAEIVLAETGAVEEWDPLTGKTREVQTFGTNDGTLWRTGFGPAGSRLFIIDTAKKPVDPSTGSGPDDDARFDAMSYPAWEFWYDHILRPGRKTAEVLLGPVWKFTRTDPNVLTLDRCRYRLQRSKLSTEMPVWLAQKAVRKKLGLRPVWENGGVQRWCWIDSPEKIGKAPTEYHFAFTVADVPRGKVQLVLEGSEHFTITLNGKKVPTKVTGWYLDRAMHTIRLPRLKPGENTLVLSCDTVDEMQVEDCFLLGDFGVDARTRAITPEPRVLHSGDWSLQGYANYAGGMVYETTVDMGATKPTAALVHLGKFSATVVAVRVNGKEAGFIPWRSADGLDVAKHLKPGANRIEIEVMGSPKNMLGPLHNARGKTPWTGCGEFRTTGALYTKDCNLWPWGLMGQVRIDLYR